MKRFIKRCAVVYEASERVEDGTLETKRFCVAGVVTASGFPGGTHGGLAAGPRRPGVSFACISRHFV